MSTEIETNISLEELAISEEQAKDIALIVYEDIGEYISQHISEFIEWILEEVGKTVVKMTSECIIYNYGESKYYFD